MRREELGGGSSCVSATRDSILDIIGSSPVVHMGRIREEVSREPLRMCCSDTWLNTGRRLQLRQLTVCTECVGAYFVVHYLDFVLSYFVMGPTFYCLWLLCCSK